MGLDALIFVYWMLSFKPTFSFYSFTFVKRLFSSSSLSAIRVVSFAYLKLLIFLPAFLIPACASSSPAFLMMYSAYKLNKQGDNIQPWCTPFLIWNQSIVPCPVLTVTSWPACRFLRRQVSIKLLRVHSWLQHTDEIRVEPQILSSCLISTIVIVVVIVSLLQDLGVIIYVRPLWLIVKLSARASLGSQW